MPPPSIIYRARKTRIERLRLIVAEDVAMVQRWTTKNVLITVRTYPVPSHKGIEVSCTAGITDDGRWIRLFPVPYRFLDNDKRFQKYQWIQASTIKAPNDTRPESFKLNADSIEVGKSVPTTNGWRARRAVVGPLIGESL